MRAFERYLADFGRFKNPDENDWKIIKAIYILRNRFVHNAGLMPPSENKTEMINLLRDQNAGLYIKGRVAYEKQRQMMITENNKLREEKSKIEIKTLADLRRSLEMNHYFYDVPPPLRPDTIFEERIYLQTGFPEFAIKKVGELIATTKREHEELCTKPHLIK